MATPVVAPGRLSRAWVRRVVPPLGDALIAAVFVVGTAAEALTGETARSALAHALLALPAMLVLAWRRRFPLTVAAAVMVSNLAINPDGEFSTLLALVLVSFTLGSELDPPRSWWGLAVVVVPFIVALGREGLEPSDVAAAVVFLIGPWAVGVALRQRSAHAADAVERATRLEQERESHLAAAAAEERVRIARELHDIVSHSISVVAIQTQAVRRRLGPEHEREAADLAAVETTARQALAEMRRLFGVLRADGEPAALAPQPGMAELDRLIEQIRAAGLSVELRVEGDPVDLPPGVDLTAYRVAQEGLTNILRHASAQHASVRVRYDRTCVHVVVEDDGLGPRDQDGGLGLVGIRERVSMYGGAVEFGPGADAGTRLAVSLPARERR